jgi:large subunit ribosomal protein L19
MNLAQEFEQDQITKLSEGKKFPKFIAGDTVKVHVKIIEGTTERVQVYEGLCIGRKNRGLGSSFTVRKISHGEGVERIFPLYSPKIANIELVKRGVVRRAKLYYMRDLRGKSARIKTKLDYSLQS